MSSREWGQGQPLIALHPLGLESSAFEGLGNALAEEGVRTIAVDLPGFGATPAPGGRLTPAVLAEPVLSLARELEPRPVLLGYSMGGRVALEAILSEPESFRSAIILAPHLPWTRFRWATPLANLMSPELADRVPIEMLWPLLKWVAHELQTLPLLKDDSVAQAGVRLIYYMSCPATRASIVSAAREMALDPAEGPQALWTRLASLALPTTFIWGERDRMVPLRFAYKVAKVAPQARQISLPCVSHAMNGPHCRCLAALVAWLLSAAHVIDAEHPPLPGVYQPPGAPFESAPCQVDGAPGALSEAPA